MTLTSFGYLLFLPIVFILYWALFNRNKNWQNGFLLVANLIFYGWWDWRFLVLLLFMTMSTYTLGNLLAHSEERGKRRNILLFTLLIAIGILIYFKYMDFFRQSFADMFALAGINISVSTLGIILPVGISFYTFSALSYVIDIYQRKIEPTEDWLAYFTFVTFFPSVLCGPINRATRQLPQYFQKRELSFDFCAQGCKMILWGIFIKVCLADQLGIYVDVIYRNISRHNGTTLFLAQLFFSIQIYADFAGYSLIAIGSGKLLGIELPENFHRPYFAKTITEFWRRWHISLTTWFRDYIYFPLGGNQVSKRRWMSNIIIVFIISGLWHGAAYTFVVWGASHGIAMVIERLIYGRKIKSIKPDFSIVNLLRMFITFNLASFAWIFFRMDTVGDAVYVIHKILTDYGMPFISKIDILLPAVISMIILTVKDHAEEYGWRIRAMDSGNIYIRYTSYTLLICYILACGELDGSSFIYFQF